MTELRNLPRMVYVSAAASVLYPLSFLGLAADEPVDSPVFIFCAVAFLTFLLVARWDLVGLWWQYLFLGWFLLLAYRKGGLLVPLLILAFLAVVWALFRRPSRKPTLNLEFPLRRGTYYVAHGGSLTLLNHHRVSGGSQSYALDIVRLNRIGTRAAGLYPTRPEAYSVFGDIVCSPCAGEITSVVNDLPDMMPGERDGRNVAGNYVLIRTDEGNAEVVLAHLMRGSVQVNPRDRVLARQPLARVGNSGNTTEPHLHIHAKRGGDRDSVLGGEGVPMSFDGRWLVRNSLVRPR